jgi:hypothetical protein
MGKVADMRARTLNDLFVSVDQGVGFAREGRNLFRESSGETFGATRPDSGKPVGDTLERGEAEADLKGRREQQNGREYGKRDDQRLIKRARFLRDFGGVASYSNEIMPFIAEIDIALD